MKIVIAGSGDTSRHLAKILSAEHHDVRILSQDRETLSELDDKYNVMTLPGDPTSARSLSEAGAGNADLFIGVTPDASANILGSQIASWLGARRTFARVGDAEYASPDMVGFLEQTGVGMAIYPEELVAREIRDFISHSWASRYYEVHGGQLIFAGLKVSAEGLGCGKTLMDIQMQAAQSGNAHKFHVSAIKRRGRLLIPRGADTLQENDVAYFVLPPESADLVAALAGSRACRIKSVFISGAGAIARQLIELLGKDFEITLLDPDPGKCGEFAARFPYLTVVNSDIRDLATLRSEQLGEMDLFIALEGDSSKNIVSSMVARELGVKKTIAQIEDVQYLSEAERLGIDMTVNKKLLTSSAILHDVLGNGVRVKSMMSLPDAEVAEIEILPDSRATKADVKDLSLPQELTLGGLVRHDEGHLIHGRTRLEAGDLVIVIFLPGASGKVAKYFRK